MLEVKRAITSNIHELTVIRSLEENGWFVTNTGWPDLLAVKDNEVLLIEVKRPNQRLKPNQEHVRDSLRKLGVLVQIRKPKVVGISLGLPGHRKIVGSVPTRLVNKRRR